MAWSSWRPFPDPRLQQILTAPLGPGCYELRHISNKTMILFGEGSFVAQRMTSLLPKPFGSGTRSNSRKRDYILKHLHDIEYRTYPCADKNEAKLHEKKLKAQKALYVFPT